jgi:hypothetical protein
MAAHGQHRPRDLTPLACSAGSACGDPSLPDPPATRNAGPEVPARPPVKTTANFIASRTGQRPGSRDTDGEAKGFTVIIDPAHAASRRVQRGPPAKTTPTSIASGPGRAPSQGARARQLDTDGNRQAVPRADRWTGGSSCASQSPPVLERAHDRSRRSHRLKRHENHRQDIGGLYDHVRPHEGCE